MCRKLILFLFASLVLLVFLAAREGNSQAPAPAPPPPKADLGLPPPVPSVFPETLGSNHAVPKKLANIWTMQMEQVEGRNIVRATIGKKSEIRIESDIMDYQTQKGIFTAQGKVELSGVSVRCRCERLSINLNEDRLVLEGKAEVRTFKERRYEKEEEVGNPERVLLELTGEQLSLHWPDLLIKADSRKSPLPNVKTVEKKE